MEDKKIDIIGIDHGWSNMKTVSSIFTSGINCEFALVLDKEEHRIFNLFQPMEC